MAAGASILAGAFDGLLLCPTKALLGLPCPGCGLTRATRLALAGDVAGATAMHPLVWIVVPLLVVLGAVEGLGYLRTGAWGTALQSRAARVALYGAAGLMFVVWAARFLGAFGGPAT